MRSLLLLLVLLLSCECLALQTVVETRDRTLNGQLLLIAPDSLEVEIDGQVTVVPIESVLGVRFPADQVSAKPLAGEARLVDGSVVRHVDWEVQGDRVLLVVDGEGPRVVIETALDQMISWRLPSEEAGRAEAWKQIESEDASDQLVVATRSGALRAVSGAIESLNDDGVLFLLEGDPVEVPWSRAAGLIFYRADRGDSTPSTARLRGREGSVFVGSGIAADPPWLSFTMASGQELRLPLDRIREIDFSSGKVFEASELEVISASWKPFFGRGYTLDDPPEETSVSGGLPRPNSAFDGSPISLLAPDSRSAGVWSRESFTSGWALRSRGRLELRLPSGARRLDGLVGVDPLTAATGSAEVTVSADGETLWSGVVEGGQPPIELSLPLNGQQRPTLSVDYGDNLDTGDSIHFAGLRVLR